jgi:hypothetical protein
LYPACLLKEFQAGHARHFHVRENEIEAMFLQRFQGLGAVGYGRNPVTLLTELKLQHLAQAGVIIGQENVNSHQLSSA